MIITIILMSFLVLLMVSMAALTRVETQIATNSQQAAAARENALLALNLALGKLQAAAGPDQRITATGDILATTQPTKKKWTGVWNSQNGNQIDWLVSDPTPVVTTAAPPLAAGQNYNDASSTVRLVGAGSTDLTVSDPVTGNEIVLSKQPLKASGIPGQGSGPTTIGNYAWWIGDEGVKARINLYNPTAERLATTTGAPALAAFSPSDAQKRQSLMVPPRVGGELLASEPIPPATPTYLGDTIYPAAVSNPGNNSPTATHANFLRDLSKLQMENQVEFLGTGFTSAMRKNRFHDFTVSSRGVLADVAAGGLKKDLTAAFMGSTIPAGAPANNTPLITVPSGVTNKPALLPSWGALRSYVQIQNGISGATPTVTAVAPTNTSMGVSPVVLHHQMYCHAAIETVGTATTPKNTLSLMYFPAVVLWNPYDVTISAQDYAGQFSFSASSSAAPYLAQVYAEFDTTTAGKKSWKWSQGTFGTYVNSVIGRVSKGLIIKCPTLAPGQAIVFTPAANQDYLTATHLTPLTLNPGWRTNFWHEDLRTTGNESPSPGDSSTQTPATTDTLSRMVIAIGSNTTGFDLYVNSSLKSSAPYSPLGTSAQRVLANTFPSGANLGSPAPITEAFYLGASQKKAIQITSPGQRPSDLLPSSPSAPAFGLIVSQKMTNANDPGKEIAWVGQYNPAAQVVNRSILDNLGNDGGSAYTNTPNCVASGFTTQTTAFAVHVNNINTGEAYVGYDHNSGGQIRAILFHLPRKETGVLSLAALQHANVHPVLSANYTTPNTPFGYSPSAMPAYAIGNSYAAPQIKLNKTTGFVDDVPYKPGSTVPNWASAVTLGHFDLSLLLNRLLWDKYYFSGVQTPAQMTAKNLSNLSDNPTASNYYSANLRHNFYDPANLGLIKKTPDLQDYDKAAANLLVEGAFNINSTSREAWRAVLASARNAPVINQDGTTALANNSQTTPFPRSPYPIKATAYPALTANNANVYVGFRSLTDAQLDELARAIVAQLKARATDSGYGPFRSMADFVNRRPEAGIQAHQLRGLIQAAIESTSINNGLNTPADLSGLADIPTTATAYFDLIQVKDAGSIPRAACLPGFLTQADVLQQLGPVLSARSDTFRVRTYGEVVNPATNGIVSRAWCEAIVQRLPEYVDTKTNTPETIPTSGTTNDKFGRRFKIISFRWLSPSDL